MRKRYLALGLGAALLLAACAKPSVPPQQITVVTPAVARLPAAAPQSRVFTYVDEQRGFKAAGDLVFTTGDGGRTWQQAGSAGSPVNYLDFVSATEGWAATDAGLRHTADGGHTWQAAAATVQDRVEQVDFADRQHGWMNSQRHLLATVDGGVTWTERDLPCNGMTNFSRPTADSGFLICAPSGIAMGHQAKSLYHTDDGGNHWSLVTEVLPSRTAESGFPEYGAATDLFFLPDGQHGWLSTDRNGAYATADGGQTWRQLGLALGADFRGIRFPTPAHGYALSNWAPGLVLETRDGGATWTQIYPDLRPAGAIALLDDQTVIGTGTLQDNGAILRSADGGRHWEQVAAIDGVTVSAFSFADAKAGWAVAYPLHENHAELYRTADGGRTWTGPLPGFRNLDLTGLSLSLFDANTGYVIDHTGTLRKTTDGGNSFTTLPQPLGQDATFAFTDLQHGWKLAGRSLYTTADAGQTWAPVDLPFKVSQVRAVSATQAWVVAVCDAPACSDQFLLSTADGGRTWTRYNLGFALYDVVPARDNRQIIAVGYQELLVTADGGKRWTQIK